MAYNYSNLSERAEPANHGEEIRESGGGEEATKFTHDRLDQFSAGLRLTKCILIFNKSVQPAFDRWSALGLLFAQECIGTGRYLSAPPQTNH